MKIFSWHPIREAKELRRVENAARPLEEKMRVLEKLRERDSALRQSRARLFSGNDARTATHVVQIQEQSSSVGSIHVLMLGASPSLIATAVAFAVDARAPLYEATAGAEQRA